MSDIDPFAGSAYNRFVPGNFMDRCTEEIPWRRRIDELTDLIDRIRIRFMEGLSIYGTVGDGKVNPFFDEGLRDDYRMLQRFYRDAEDPIDWVLVHVAAIVSFVGHGKRKKSEALEFLIDLENEEV